MFAKKTSGVLARAIWGVWAGVITASAGAADFCPSLSHEGVFRLEFMPGPLHVDRYPDGDSLTVASFLNAARGQPGQPPFVNFQRDLVARIPRIQQLDPADFVFDRDLEILTDRQLSGARPGLITWPNDVETAPDGMLPFAALVIPQGFHTAPVPGRLSLINLDDPERREYLVHQSTQSGAFTTPLDPQNSPRFYHKVVFADMDADGLKDIVTVRAGFRVGRNGHPPFGELVYFKNPGAALKPDVPWQEVILYGGPATQYLGPDIDIYAADFDNDGSVELVTTTFFATGQKPSTGGTITLFGAPDGGSWKDVNALQNRLPKVKIISADQGFPFGTEVVDLNNDGRLDILATNHQGDNCTPATSSAVPGRVYALEMPADGDLFNSPWTTHILKDNIRPQPSPPGTRPPGRLTPGQASSFFPVKFLEGLTKPHIVVGGDEAGKVWVLAPKKTADSSNWEYDSAVIFDINAFYGENTTQTRLTDPQRFGRTMSTVGKPAVGYSGNGSFAVAEIYVPVYEGKAIHKFRYRWLGGKRIDCTADVRYDCPVAKP